jgi:hypothetical protein
MPEGQAAATQPVVLERAAATGLEVRRLQVFELQVFQLQVFQLQVFKLEVFQLQVVFQEEEVQELNG